MADLKSPRLIIFKGFLFLILGCLSGGLIIVEHPTLKLISLLALSTWSFCRFYYFAFYVIQHYIDPTYKFAGLFSFVRYLLAHRFNAR
jgi:hypothetical protein